MMKKKYIETETFKAYLRNLRRQVNDIVPGVSVISATSVSQLIDEYPAADVVEARHAKWEELMEHRGAGGILGGKDICIGYACSECGEQSDIMTYYCPYCGAKMNEVEE